jgi:hypothetical protein
MEMVLLSFLYKTMIDSVAGAFHLPYGYENFTLPILYAFEMVFVFTAIVGILGLRIVMRKWKGSLEIEQVNLS